LQKIKKSFFLILGRNNRGLKEDHPEESSSSGVGQNDLLKDEDLDCGKPVNFTYYDHLVGIQNRASHPHIPEPEVASTFRGISAKSKNREADIDLIERRLKRSKREKPKSVDLYNQIGNFWRIKGDTHKSIECFRRALAVSPNNADILLNLARVLFNLQYLDDAIFLTRRSLEVNFTEVTNAISIVFTRESLSKSIIWLSIHPYEPRYLFKREKWTFFCEIALGYVVSGVKNSTAYNLMEKCIKNIMLKIYSCNFRCNLLTRMLGCNIFNSARFSRHIVTTKRPLSTYVMYSN
jgi:tetratricopeptide (TPR) repeat protein